MSENRKDSQRGRAFTYRFLSEEKEYKQFVPGATFDAMEHLYEKIERNTGEKIFITSEKPMTLEEFKKWNL